MLKKTGFAVASLLALTTLVSACGDAKTTASTAPAAPAAAAPAAPIKIGFINPLTGDSATYGVFGQNGMQVAIDEINAQGGVKGRKLELVPCDDGGDPNQAVACAQKLADQKDILAISGSSLSTSTLAMIPIIDKAKLPDVTFSSSSPKLEGASKYFFRMGVQDGQVGGLVGELASKALKSKKMAILFPNSDYGKGLNDGIKAKIKELGSPEIVADLDYMATDKDFSAILTKVQALNPDVIALAGTYTDGSLIIKQAREMGMKQTFINGTGLNSPKFPEIAGAKAAEGAIFLGVFVPTSQDPKVQDFVKKFQAKANTQPDHFGALAYDVLHVIAAAAGQVNGDLTRDSLRDAIAKINYQGLTGTVTFTDKNDWVRPYIYITYKDGQFVQWKAQ